jgi:hypothetical protein
MAYYMVVKIIHLHLGIGFSCSLRWMAPMIGESQHDDERRGTDRKINVHSRLTPLEPAFQTR